MRRILTALLLLACSSASAANYATCILDKMPGTQNDVAARAVYQLCNAKHPGGILAVAQGSGRGLFSHDSGAECTVKKAGDTRSNQAALFIGVACRKLYEEDWENGVITPPPSFEAVELWTQKHTGSSEKGPWLNYLPKGSRFCRLADGAIVVVFPPGVKPQAEKANPFCATGSVHSPDQL